MEERILISDIPLVTVIIPVYRSSLYIEAAIRSVMAQTITNWELIVIDDYSDDGTPEIVRSLAQEDTRIRLVCNERNMGVARTRNRGMDMARGSYIALLDSDDVWLPDKLERQLSLMAREKADLCYCSYAIVNAQGERCRPDYLVPESADFNLLLKENVIGCSTVVMSRRTVEDHRFTTDFYHEDYVFWVTLLQEGFRAVGCTEPLVHWRFIESSRSYDKRKAAISRWRIYRDYLHLSIGRSLSSFVAYFAASTKKYFRKLR